MQALSLAWGILALGGMLVGLIPCFGWLNWFNIPFALAGFIFSVVVHLAGRGPNRQSSLVAIVLCVLAILVGSKHISTAPHSSWRERFLAMTPASPLPGVELAVQAYDTEKSDPRLRALVIASAGWNFTSAGLSKRKQLLARLPTIPRQPSGLRGLSTTRTGFAGGRIAFAH